MKSFIFVTILLLTNGVHAKEDDVIEADFDAKGSTFEMAKATGGGKIANLLFDDGGIQALGRSSLNDVLSSLRGHAANRESDEAANDEEFGVASADGGNGGRGGTGANGGKGGPGGNGCPGGVDAKNVLSQMVLFIADRVSLNQYFH
ncbi:hypothetical protein FOZ61_006886 [Perkinsus olseni]|uniref:Uncharacterized protein n=1 Tax=Perkinsus olseni TaxID=32597 RepID=A0A7J6M9I1_PEROL|nr:hypothetical protein FOZ61_006886 [Perkinsus olseni]KAF4673738.1 hypothetical protein FOL46_006596 [Perkinsus olseni]